MRNSAIFALILSVALLYGAQDSLAADSHDHSQMNNDHGDHKMAGDHKMTGDHKMSGDHKMASDHKMMSPAEMNKRLVKWMPLALSKVGTKVDGSLSFIDSSGKKVSLGDFFGEPFFITFMFTTCPHICPTINGNMGRAARVASSKHGDKFRLITVSFDVETDDVSMMKDYSEGYLDDFPNWTFGMAEKETVKDLTSAFGFSYMPHPEEIWAHISLVTAVGKDGLIVKQIIGTKVAQDEFDTALESLLH